MEMDNDNIAIPTAQIVMPNGSKRVAELSQTAMEVIKNIVDLGDNYDDYALVFNGRKLQFDQKLESVPQIDSNRPMRMIRRNETNNFAKKEEITRLLNECRNSYKTMIEDAYPPQISAESYQMLLTYIVENHGQQYENAIKEYPNIVFDQLGQDILRDWRLLIPYIMENEQFAHEHPYCVRIFKKALDAISAKFSSNSPYIRYGAPANFLAAVGPSNRREDVPTMARNNHPPPIITQQQLSQALASALGVAPNAPPPPVNRGPVPVEVPMPQQEHGGIFQNAQQNFADQLERMHDFGFANDEENIQALMLTNGDVQQALEIVIAMREST